MTDDDDTADLLSEIMARNDHKIQAMMAASDERTIPLQWESRERGWANQILVARRGREVFTVFQDSYTEYWNWYRGAEVYDPFDEESSVVYCEEATAAGAIRDCQHELWSEGRLPFFLRQVRRTVVDNAGGDWAPYEAALCLCRRASTAMALLGDISSTARKIIAVRDREIKRLMDKDD
jgi:hypothetical protein